MIRNLYLVILFLSFACSSPKIWRQPSSEIFTEEQGLIFSPIVNQEVPYWIMRPSIKSRKPLPVVYFLHGRGGSSQMFKELHGVKVYKEYLERGGKPFALVALTGTYAGQDTYWVNDARVGGPQWADAILKQIIPKLENKHGIGGVENRAIAGISMGSHGAFQLALNSKGMFKCVAGHSLVLRDYQSFSEHFPGLFGTPEDFAKRDPLSLLRRHNLSRRIPIDRVWIDIGGKDLPEFIKWALPFKKELERAGFGQIRPNYMDIGRDFPQGDHSYSYWIERLPEYVAWYGQCFK